MLPVTKYVMSTDVEDVERMVHYQVWYETHPLYKDVPIRHLKKMFDFSRDESVPDIAIVKIDTGGFDFDMDCLKEEIMANEGIEDKEDIVFE